MKITLTDADAAKIADGCIACEGTGKAVSRYDRNGDPTAFEWCSFCGVKAASDVVAARVAEALRDAANLLYGASGVDDNPAYWARVLLGKADEYAPSTDTTDEGPGNTPLES